MSFNLVECSKLEAKLKNGGDRRILRRGFFGKPLKTLQCYYYYILLFFATSASAGVCASKTHKNKDRQKEVGEKTDRRMAEVEGILKKMDCIQQKGNDYSKCLRQNKSVLMHLQMVFNDHTGTLQEVSCTGKYGKRNEHEFNEHILDQSNRILQGYPYAFILMLCGLTVQQDRIAGRPVEICCG